MWTENFQIYKLGLELPNIQAEEPKVKLPTFIGSDRKQGNSRKKTSILASLTTLKPLTVWITINWKILKELGIPDHLTFLLRSEVKSLSCVWLFAIPWTVVYQASLSMGFCRQEYWSGLPFPSLGDLPDPGIEPRSPALQADAFLSESAEEDWRQKEKGASEDWDG